MKAVRRAQIGRRSGIDVTVKAGLLVSPTWTYVMGYKNGRISAQQYTNWYLKRLEDSSEAIIAWAIELPDEITFLCYCRDGDFCHTYILARWLAKTMPDVFEDATIAPAVVVECL